MEAQSTRLRRWTRAEYARLIEAGIFRAGEPVELLGEHLMVGEPQDSAHYTAIGLVEERSPGRARTRLAGPLARTARARRRLGAGARRRADARRPAGLPRRASLAPRARHRGRGVEPRARPRAQGKPLRAGGHRRL